GHEYLARSDAVADLCVDLDSAPAGFDAHSGTVGDAKTLGVFRRNFSVAGDGRPLHEEGDLPGAGLCVELDNRAATGEQRPGVFVVRYLARCHKFFEKYVGSSVGCEELAVGEEAPRTCSGRCMFRIRPLDSLGFNEVLVALDSRDVAGL